MSGNQGTFYPPALVQPFPSASPPTKSDHFLNEGGSREYFQNYRNQTLSKFSTPRYDWSTASVPYAPKPEMNAATVRRNINRDLNAPSNRISTVDPIRMKEVDDLYKGAQMHRGQYKDRTASFHPLSFFEADDYPYRCAARMTRSYLSKYPRNYVEQKIPTVLPLTGERRKETAYIPDFSLTGIYDPSSCIAYKR